MAITAYFQTVTVIVIVIALCVQVMWDAESGQYLLPHKAFTKMFQVRTEVQLLDPAANWDFVAWLTASDKLDFYEKAAAFCLFCRITSLILDWGAGTPIWRMWTTRKKKKVRLCRAVLCRAMVFVQPVAF